MMLVDDWKKAWRWLSVQVGALVTVLPLVWMQMPEDVKDMIPPTWRPVIVSAMGVAMVLGRMKSQKVPE